MTNYRPPSRHLCYFKALIAVLKSRIENDFNKNKMNGTILFTYDCRSSKQIPHQKSVIKYITIYVRNICVHLESHSKLHNPGNFSRYQNTAQGSVHTYPTLFPSGSDDLLQPDGPIINERDLLKNWISYFCSSHRLEKAADIQCHLSI